MYHIKCPAVNRPSPHDRAGECFMLSDAAVAAGILLKRSLRLGRHMDSNELCLGLCDCPLLHFCIDNGLGEDMPG